MSRRPFVGDSRGVAPVIGFIFLIGVLVLFLGIYQAQVVPQQNAETELEHHEDTRYELQSLHNAISAVGETGEPRFHSITLGTTYDGRTVAVNPPPPAGTIRTEQHNISITNESGSGTPTNITTQFIEYQPGYNELDIGSTWYENSVLYFDERDRGNSIGIIEDQEIVEDGNATIVALQNEFHETGTGRVTFELYPSNDLDAVSLPDENGTYTVEIPTRLDESYWETQLEGELGENIEQDFETGEPNVLNLSVESNVLELSSVGIRLVPPGVDEGSEGEHDYGEKTNYRDGDSGDAAQPEEPSGEIEDPSNVNDEDGNTSTAISAGSEEDLNVGFALPPTDESAETYEMRFVIEDITAGDGDFGFSLVNSDGEELTGRQVLEEGDNIYSFDDDEEQAISDNYDDLHLILDSETSGSGNRELEMDYFELLSE